MNNMGFILQPHFNTHCFRVAVNDQQGTEYNYITVTCSPKYNGIWKYPASNVKMYKHWKNKSIECLCVPITDCTFLQTLDSIKTESIRNKVKAQQQKWYKNQIQNRDYNYNEKPTWLL